MAYINENTLNELVELLKSNIGRGSSEKIGENTYEVKDLNKSIREDIDWLEAKESQFDPTLRTTQKIQNRYGG